MQVIQRNQSLLIFKNPSAPSAGTTTLILLLDGNNICSEIVCPTLYLSFFLFVVLCFLEPFDGKIF
jgi:hypothetical protein